MRNQKTRKGEQVNMSNTFKRWTKEESVQFWKLTDYGIVKYTFPPSLILTVIHKMFIIRIRVSR